MHSAAAHPRDTTFRCKVRRSSSANAYALIMKGVLALSFPLACCSEGALQQPTLMFVQGLVPATHCAKAAGLRLPIATARPALLSVAQRHGQTVHAGLSVVSRRLHDLVAVRDAPRANAAEQAVGEVKELSSDLMVPGVAMIVTMPVGNSEGLVSPADVKAQSCWISVNGIPLKACKFDFRSNFWGTKRTLDFHVRIPPEHLDEAGLGMLYPGDDVALARMEEHDALAFKAKFAEAKLREKLIQQQQQEFEAEQQGEAEQGQLETEIDLKSQLDSQYPTLTRALDSAKDV